MTSSIRFILTFFLFTLGSNSSFAHFSMLLPDRSSIKGGEPVSLTYQWGHPFEHEMFDAQAPAQATILLPDGKLTPLTAEETTVSEGDKKHRAYRFQFQAGQRGDYVFFVKSQPIWMEEEQEFLVDYAKVVVHVQA